MEQRKQKVHKRAKRSRKQTKLKIATIKTVYSSSHSRSCTVEVVGVVPAAARRAELSVGSGGLMVAWQVAFCMVGGCFQPMLAYNSLLLASRGEKKTFFFFCLILFIKSHFVAFAKSDYFFASD